MNEHLLRMTALAVLQMEKIMAAELDRLNAAVAANDAAVAAVSAKVAELVDMIRNAPPSGIDPAAVDAAAAAIEAAAQSLTNVSATQV
jgi:hypothetical protein